MSIQSLGDYRIVEQVSKTRNRDNGQSIEGFQLITTYTLCLFFIYCYTYFL